MPRTAAVRLSEARAAAELVANEVPYDGTSALSFGAHADFLEGKHVARTLSIAATAVEAPGDAPRSPAIDPSACETTSVPNFRTPPLSASLAMT